MWHQWSTVNQLSSATFSLSLSHSECLQNENVQFTGLTVTGHSNVRYNCISIHSHTSKFVSFLCLSLILSLSPQHLFLSSFFPLSAASPSAHLPVISSEIHLHAVTWWIHVSGKKLTHQASHISMCQCVKDIIFCRFSPSCTTQLCFLRAIVSLSHSSRLSSSL